MKKTCFAMLLLLALSGSALADQRVKGHYRDTDGDGYKETYVQPYSRTSPDNNRYNNYSTQGNTNPYTGEKGSVDPYANTAPKIDHYPINNNRSIYR